MSSSLYRGTYLCGLVSTRPDGLADFVGNDICSDTSVSNMTVVTHSQTAQQRQAAAQNDTSSGEMTDIPPSTTPSPEVQEEDDPVGDLLPLFNKTPVELLASLESIDLSPAPQDLRNRHSLGALQIGLLLLLLLLSIVPN